MREARYLKTYSEQQAAGLIIVPPDGVVAALKQIHPRDIPVVLMDRPDLDPLRFSVSVGDFYRGRSTAEHLIGLGHRRIAFVGSLAPPNRYASASVECAASYMRHLGR